MAAGNINCLPNIWPMNSPQILLWTFANDWQTVGKSRPGYWNQLTDFLFRLYPGPKHFSPDVLWTLVRLLRLSQTCHRQILWGRKTIHISSAEWATNALTHYWNVRPWNPLAIADYSLTLPCKIVIPTVPTLDQPAWKLGNSFGYFFYYSTPPPPPPLFPWKVSEKSQKDQTRSLTLSTDMEAVLGVRKSIGVPACQTDWLDWLDWLLIRHLLG